MTQDVNGITQSTATSSEQNKNAQQRIVALISHAKSFYKRVFPMPSLKFNLRGQCAGQLITHRITWYRRSYIIRINNELFCKYPSYFLEQVFPHEVAHLIVDQLTVKRIFKKPKPHGIEWQKVMRDCFQVPPKCYHELPVVPSRVVAKPYRYQCSCSEHFFTERRHRNATKGRSYICCDCKQLLIHKPSLNCDHVI